MLSRVSFLALIQFLILWSVRSTRILRRGLRSEGSLKQNSLVSISNCRHFFSRAFLSCLGHDTLLSVRKKMAAGKHQEIHDVQQSNKMVPFITCETTFGQDVRELFFGVNIFDLDLWVLFSFTRNEFGTQSTVTARQNCPAADSATRHLQGMRSPSCDTTCRDHWTPRALACANCQKNSAASSLHRPPVSMATTTSRHRLPFTSSGKVLSLSSRLAWKRTAPSSSAAPGCGSPEPHRALRNVTSTANWAPLKQGGLCQHLDAPFIVGADSQIHVPQKRVALDPAPASRQIRANMRSVGVARFRTRPDRVHAARCRPCRPRGSWHKLQTASVIGSGKFNLSKSNTRKKCGSTVNSAVCKHNPSVETGVRSQVRSAGGRTAGHPRVLPERAVEDGRIPTPSTVWPLARLANLSLRRALALVQFWP